MVIGEVFTQEFFWQSIMFIGLLVFFILIYLIIREATYFIQKRKKNGLEEIGEIKEKEKKLLKNLKKEKKLVNKKIQKLKK
ncbi:hypothetical protein HOD88_03710 [archaeon]|jgi:flagellar biosynthesis/type III secretory pathway M-ring protein FliF/YscJ|nr:hypothetical protein [archaeon]MBT6734976.1 hypothetical protein [Candidatus Woesearchaeota archaeon]